MPEPPKPERPVVTLTTDFGLEDTYVAQVKGVILAGCPRAAVVDVTHAIPRHDVGRGAAALDEAARAFPRGTTHVAVVDPGVGSERAVIAVEVGGHRFVGPDNGVLSLVRGRHDEAAVVRIENKAFRRPFVSGTFHGRDLMAPAAAALARGADIDLLGPRVTDMVRLPREEPRREGDLLIGGVARVDHFGNVITTVSGREGVIAAVIGEAELPVVTHYAAAERGAAVTLVGSNGHFEIAVRDGSAAERFGLSQGDEVRFRTGAAS